MTLYTLRYNNYYNRIKKGFNTVAEYQPFILDTLEETNYNPRDGVSTTKTLNIDDDKVPDYIIFADDDDTIVSRWFVIESNRTRRRQYVCSLLRDVIMDWKEQIYAAPSFIHKGYLSSNDTGIYLPEDITVNQIKKSERLLKDKTNIAWLVGYLAPAAESGNIEVEYGGKAEPDLILSTPITEWEYYNQETVNIKNYNYADFRITYLGDGFSTHGWGIWANNTTSYLGNGLERSGFSTDPYIDPVNRQYPTTLFVTQELARLDLSACRDAINRYYDVATKETLVQALSRQVGIVQDSTGKQYAVSLVTTSTDYKESLVYDATNTAADALYDVVQQINDAAEEINGYSNTIAYSAGYSCFDIVGTETTYEFKVEEFNLTSGHTLTIPDTVKYLIDAPYRMFCIPYGDNYAITTPTKLFGTTRINSLALATSIMISAGSACYDVQLLPYCPVRRIRDAGPAGITLSEIGQEGVDYVLAEATDSIIIFGDQSKDTFDIPFSQTILAPNDTIGVKTKALTSFSRLCSPNYSGMFEYSPIKNGGVTSINVDIDYKPYNPYIHLNIDFGGIYGKDFNDARGLICGGDFSITRIDSAWTQYQLENKNYNEIFNKNIDKMEFEAKYARVQDIANAITGGLSGLAGGFAGGSIVGGGALGAVGAIVGGGLSAGAGIADVRINEKMRQYNIDFTKDLQSLSLGNIQAMPYSLSKVSAFNNNNKIWPFVENYECSPEEYEAVYNKIKYNGMTINRVGTLSYYIEQKPIGLDYGFFQTTPIRLDNIAEDSHICNAIAAELAQGVFL